MMKKVLLSLLPIFVIMLVMVIGFTILHDIGASPSDTNNECADLWEICSQEANYASVTCNKYGSDSNWCQWAEEDAAAACDAAANCD